MPSVRIMRTLLASVLVSFFTCTQTRPAFTGGDAPEVDTIKLKSGVVEVPKTLSSAAVVKPDSLEFPAEMAAEVAMKWQPGTPLVGAPGQDLESRRQNPFGFLRKVTGTHIEGDKVIVDTERALLDDVITGDFSKTLDLTTMPQVTLPEGVDLSQYDTPITFEGEYFPPPGAFLDGGVMMQPVFDPSRSVNRFGTKRQAFTGGLPTFTVPSRQLTVLKFKQKWTPPGSPLGLNISGQVKVTPTASIRPALEVQMSANIVQGLKYFKLAVGTGDFKYGTAIDVDYDAIPDRDLTLVQAAQSFDLLKRTPIKLTMPPIPLDEPVLQEFFIGVVPFVSATGAYLVCDGKLTGTMHAKGSLSGTYAGPQFGFEYKDGDTVPITRFPSFTPSANGQVISGQGGVEVECGIAIRTELLAAGLAGPYAQLKAAAVGTADYVEFCPNNDPAPRKHAPNAKIDFGVKAYMAAQVGLELTLAHIVTIEKGPYDIARVNVKEGPGFDVPNPGYPRWSQMPTINVPSWLNIVSASYPLGAIGRGPQCMVQCEDGSKNGAETDLDCGSNCAPCTKGKQCTADTDCLSRMCAPSGTCVGSRCEDGVKGQEETDIDCGGPTCAPCPPLRWPPGSSQPVANACLQNRDCAESICSNDGLPHVCTTNLCRDGLKTNTESDVDCGNSPGCDLCALGRKCVSEADCQSGACNAVTGVCVANTCLDARTNGTETDVDCGGSCPNKCPAGAACAPPAGTDCVSNLCSSASLTCVTTTCLDGRLTGDETDVDCGGATCSARCVIGQFCGTSTDCTAGSVCNARTHQCSPPGCNDGLKNGQESSIDCGGPTCAKCGIAKSCNSGNDCVSTFCSNGRCINGPCDNGVKDTGEADVDCGGVCSGIRCATGKACNTLDDCASGICANNVCVSDPCLDKVRNGSESDVDCGGTCATKCAPTKTCNGNSDCASNLCNTTSRSCVLDACHDGLLTSGSESDIDCGGTCGTSDPLLKCAVNKACASNSDCASSVCNATTHLCVPSQCFDGMKNGTETDTDCGDTCQAKCGANKVCALATDCQSGACRANFTCATDQCSDTRLNGNETAIDCGGSCATKCAVGQGCLTGSDCVNPQGMVGVPGYCSVTSRTCTSSFCGDGVKDGDETGIDCGGSCSTKCATGLGCNTGTDCVSTFCNVTTRVCVANRCLDGVKNGAEADVDCGVDTGCSTCAVGKTCTEPWDCASYYCGASNTCVSTVPNSCLAIYNRNGPGDRTSGVKEIDPDGPRQYLATPRPLPSNVLNAPNRSPAGWDNSIQVYCDQTNDSGGWTPVIYLNSASVSFAQGTLPQRAYSSWWWYSQSCNTDADCTTSLANNKCHTVPNTTNKYCSAPGPVVQTNGSGFQMLGHPQNYSVQPGGNYNGYESMGLQVEDPYDYAIMQNGYRSGLRNDNTNPPQQYRWEVYRDGVRVYPPPGQPSVIIPATLTGVTLYGNGAFANTSTLQWFQARGDYLTNLSVPEDTSSPLDSTGSLDYRARGFAAYQRSADQLGTYMQNGLSTSLGYLVRVTDPASVAYGLPVKWAGFAYGTWGQAHRPTYLNAVRMYVCNTFASDCAANMTFHPDGENPGIYSSFEKTTPNAGTEVRVAYAGQGTPGLVFVLWAR